VRIRDSSVAEGHVRHPQQAILYRPVAADGWPRLIRWQCQGSKVEAGFPLDLFADFALAFDHDDAAQSRPILAFLQPGDVRDGGVGPNSVEDVRNEGLATGARYGMSLISAVTARGRMRFRSREKVASTPKPSSPSSWGSCPLRRTATDRRYARRKDAPSAAHSQS
jgi:hypothetical protein